MLLPGLLLAGALLVWFARRVDLAAVVDELRGIAAGWVVLAVAAQTTALVWRALRWRSLLALRHRISYRDAIEVTFMGWALLSLLPARLGEISRPLLLARRRPVERSFAFGAQMLERVLDLCAVLTLLAIYLRSSALAEHSSEGRRLLAALERGQTVAAAAAAIGIAGLVLAVIAAPRVARLHETMAGRLRGAVGRRLIEAVRSFAAGLTAVRSFRSAAVAITHTVVQWTLICSAHWCLFRAFDLELSGLAVAPLLAFIVLGAIVPTPVAIGSYHKAVQLALAALLGLPLATATGYALIGHAVGYLPNLTVGLTLLAREGATAGEIRRWTDPGTEPTGDSSSSTT
jgi:uncharacterized protein (TIRG00374 family)